MGCKETLGSNDSDGVREGNMERVSEGVGAADKDGAFEGEAEGVSLGAIDTVGLVEGDSDGEVVGGSVFKIQREDRNSESSSSVNACKGSTPKYFAGLLSMIQLRVILYIQGGNSFEKRQKVRICDRIGD